MSRQSRSAANIPVAEVAKAARRLSSCARLKATIKRLKSRESRTSLRLILRTCRRDAKYQNSPGGRASDYGQIESDDQALFPESPSATFRGSPATCRR
jgi:hypothetical protein